MRSETKAKELKISSWVNSKQQTSCKEAWCVLVKVTPCAPADSLCRNGSSHHHKWTQGSHTLLPAHSPAPDPENFSTFDEAAACGSSAPVTTFLWWKRSVVLTFCSHPLRCSTFPQSVFGLVSFGVERLLSFSPGLCSPVLSKLNVKSFHFLGKEQLWLWLSIFFLFFFPPPSLILAIYIGNLIQWSAGFVWEPKPTLWRWMCSLKPT